MDTDTPNEVAPAGRRWPWVLLIVGLLAIGADQAYRLILTSRIKVQLARLRQAGYPTNTRELEAAGPRVPDQQNAALRLLEAIDYLAIGPEAFNRQWPGRREELGPEERDTLKDILTNNAPALETIHLAAQLKQSRFPLDYSRGPNMLLPHLVKLKSLTHLLRAQTVILSEQGKPELAVQSVLDSLAVARSLDTEPLLISQLVRVACLSITCSSLERLLTQIPLSESQLSALHDGIRGARQASQTAFPGGYLGEVVFCTFCFTAPVPEVVRIMNPDAEVSTFARSLFALYAWSGLRDRDFLFCLRMVERMLDTAKQPFPQALVKAQQFTDDNTRELERHKLLIFSKMLLPAVLKSMEKAADLEARLRCAEAALNVERARLRGQPLAAALAEVMQPGSGGGLMDPIDGAPLRWRSLDPGYVIYSLGSDRADNDGAEKTQPGNSGVRKLGLSAESAGTSERKKRGGNRGSDITFVVER
jgi:hypothetical protein